MIDTRLITALKTLAEKEKKIKEYKKRLRIKGRVGTLHPTKRGNVMLTVKKDKEDYAFTILKSHKERFALANRLHEGNSISIEGITKRRYTICTRLKILEKGLPAGKQSNLEKYLRGVSS